MMAKTRLDGIFSSGMVLQRDVENIISGYEAIREKVSIRIENEEIVASVDDGRFSATIPAHAAACGLTIEIQGSSRILLEDVCFGDVFMLSGQSNMELPAERVLDNSEEVISQINLPQIRQFRMVPQYEFDRSKACELAKAPWTKAIPGEIMQMSAAGLFFAREIHAEKGVPIGLILNAQGGSSVEAWMPMTLLDRWGDYSSEPRRFAPPGALNKFIEDREEAIRTWYRRNETEGNDALAKAIPIGAENIEIPTMYPKEEGKTFSGSVWFYKEIEIDDEPSGPAMLYVGELIDSDRTYINGIKVGETAYRYPPRRYPLDSSILRKGKNLVAVRLVIEGGRGSFIFDHPYYLSYGNHKMDLTGIWSHYVEKETAPCDVPGFLSQQIPTGLFHACIETLRDVKVKGVLWYQGESNTGNANHYAEMFTSMMRVWRETMGQRLPIITTVLADYADPLNGVSSDWGEIQRIQRDIPSIVQDCAVVSAQDLGAPYELHPQDKETLGRRYAQAAKTLFYS
ncbi:MAG: hypothetical protein GXY06_04815 [Clostridiaceae bacterium]|nr:hypothetical protein [Clostridiaceae bacterium]